MASNIDDETRQIRRSPQVFKLIFFLFIIVLAAVAFISSSFFSVKQIVVKGNSNVSAEEIRAIAQIEPSSNIFKVDVNSIRERLMKDLRLEHVEMERGYPSTILLTIQERRLLAYMASSYGFVELDQQAVVIAASKLLHKMSVPIITGVPKNDLFVGDKVTYDPVVSTLAFLKNLDNQVLTEVSEVNLQNPNDVVLYTTGGVKIKLGNMEHFPDKAKLLTNVMQEIKDNSLSVEYVDLTYSTPVLKFRDKQLRS